MPRQRDSSVQTLLCGNRRIAEGLEAEMGQTGNIQHSITQSVNLLGKEQAQLN